LRNKFLHETLIPVEIWQPRKNTPKSTTWIISEKTWAIKGNFPFLVPLQSPFLSRKPAKRSGDGSAGSAEETSSRPRFHRLTERSFRQSRDLPAISSVGQPMHRPPLFIRDPHPHLPFPKTVIGVTNKEKPIF
jgi:hypothetical protein